ncbi:hypothetical protein K502DRAFT_368315 [Neoconidiobolus thromboides FSU 785]|nr:hypothetical protein K502DRAFT_368315 [Neoconidiobolus thromboides FSU 785]
MMPNKSTQERDSDVQNSIEKCNNKDAKPMEQKNGETDELSEQVDKKADKAIGSTNVKTKKIIEADEGIEESVLKGNKEAEEIIEQSIKEANKIIELGNKEADKIIEEGIKKAKEILNLRRIEIEKTSDLNIQQDENKIQKDSVQKGDTTLEINTEVKNTMELIDDVAQNSHEFDNTQIEKENNEIKNHKVPRPYLKISDADKKALLSLVDGEGKAIKDAAEQLSINYSTARGVIFKERKKIKKAEENEISEQEDNETIQQEDLESDMKQGDNSIMQENEVSKINNSQSYIMMNDDITKTLMILVDEHNTPLKEAAKQLSMSYGRAWRLISKEKKKVKETIEDEKESQGKDKVLDIKGSQSYNKISIEDKRRLLTLVIKEGKLIKEAAAELGINYGTAKGIIYQERKRLKEAMNVSETNVEEDVKIKSFLAKTPDKIGSDIKKELWKLVIEEGLPIKEVAEKLAIPYKSAVNIIAQGPGGIQKKAHMDLDNSQEYSEIKNFLSKTPDKISLETKKNLWHLVVEQKKSMKEAAAELAIKYSTAGTIVCNERKRLRLEATLQAGNLELENQITHSYIKKSDEIRKVLSKLVDIDGKSIKEAAKELNINYSSARRIVVQERKILGREKFKKNIFDKKVKLSKEEMDQLVMEEVSDNSEIEDEEVNLKHEKKIKVDEDMKISISDNNQVNVADNTEVHVFENKELNKLENDQVNIVENKKVINCDESKKINKCESEQEINQEIGNVDDIENSCKQKNVNDGN